MKLQKSLILLLVIASGIVSAQDIFGPMKSAIKAGDAEQLAKYFNQNLDVTIDGNMNNFSKQQALFAVDEFFKSHSPSDFVIVHKGSSGTGGLQFAIGKYVSSNNNYTVLIRVKEASKMWLIHEISFVKEKKG